MPGGRSGSAPLLDLLLAGRVGGPSCWWDVQVSSHMDEFIPFPAEPKLASLDVCGIGQPFGLEHCLLELQLSQGRRG